MVVLEATVSPEDFDTWLNERRAELKKGEYLLRFGSGQTVVASELCIDVYESTTGAFRWDLSTAMKA
jgi:hypothetical protein